MKSIAIASDHAGFALKTQLKAMYPDIEWMDLGPTDEQSVDYPDYAIPVAQAVAAGKCSSGVLICGSGIGMSITANKVKGIRAALCVTSEYASLARRHNDANILVLPGRFIAPHYAGLILETWLSTACEADQRHLRRIDKITKYETSRGAK